MIWFSPVFSFSRNALLSKCCFTGHAVYVFLSVQLCVYDCWWLKCVCSVYEAISWKKWNIISMCLYLKWQSHGNSHIICTGKTKVTVLRHNAQCQFQQNPNKMYHKKPQRLWWHIKHVGGGWWCLLFSHPHVVTSMSLCLLWTQTEIKLSLNCKAIILWMLH